MSHAHLVTLQQSIAAFLDPETIQDVDEQIDQIRSTMQRIRKECMMMNRDAATDVHHRIELLCDGLIDVEQSLRNTMFGHKERIESHIRPCRTTPTQQQQTEQRPLDLQAVLDYAQYISRYTAAPHAGSTNRIAYPPIPQDSHMKMSMLFRPVSTAQAQETTEATRDTDVSLLNPFELLQQETEDQAAAEEDLLDLDL